MTNPARSERLAFCAAAEELGAHAPTLCDPWDVAALAAHVVLRESRPDVAGGIMIPALAGRLERAQEELAGTDFGELVEKVRTGPPVWSPTRLSKVDDAVNLVEFYIHTEDIRRASGQPPRTLDPKVERGLGRALKRMGTLMFRKSPVGVTLEPTGRTPYSVHAATDLGEVHVAGPVGELLLVAYGRIRVAQVEVTGPDDAIAALGTAELGFGG
jgi:uncharacterized protein (TIGR03085 family)